MLPGRQEGIRSAVAGRRRDVSSDGAPKSAALRVPRLTKRAYVRRRTELWPYRAYIRYQRPFVLVGDQARDLAARAQRGIRVLHNALVFLVATLVAGLFGFTGIAGMPLGIARIVCVTFAALCLVSLSLRRRGSR